MTYTELTNQLIADEVLVTPRIIDAWRLVDRKYFVPDEEQPNAYLDIPLPLGHGATISQPYTVVLMLELLQPRPGDRCLDIGAGSGWTAALLGQIVKPAGTVIGVELLPQLFNSANAALKKVKTENVEYVTGDAAGGWEAGAPYDVIQVAAAAKQIPIELKRQLNIGGRLIIPVGEYVQELVLINKIGDNEYTERQYPGFQFVPLIS